MSANEPFFTTVLNDSCATESMASPNTTDLKGLSHGQLIVLKRGNINNKHDLLLIPPNEIARRCKTSLSEIQSIVEAFSRVSLQSLTLEIGKNEDEAITTGDSRLDDVLGGGVQTGMIWEVAGESAAGKTQFALQLSLLVQLPPTQGGLSGAACYLTTSSTLPTTRLVEISKSHPVLSSSSLCSLDHIHTMPVSTIPILIHVLSTTLRDHVAKRSTSTRPIRLIVIDALAELFHDSARTSTSTLVERSRNISEISLLLHTLASTYQVAILVLNEVVDVFNRQSSAEFPSHELLYTEQSRWFARADSIPSEGSKEVSLGLVWANQVNARILLTRTGRRRYLSDDDTRDSKWHKGSNQSQPFRPTNTSVEQQATIIRRLSVIFCSISPPASLDYIVTAAGITTLPDDGSSRPQQPLQPPAVDHSTAFSPKFPQSQLAPLDIGFVEDVTNAALSTNEDDDWEQYWKDDGFSADVYASLDLDIESAVG